MSLSIRVDTDGIRNCADNLENAKRISYEISQRLAEVQRMDLNESYMCSLCIQKAMNLIVFFSNMSDILHQISDDADRISKKISELIEENALAISIYDS